MCFNIISFVHSTKCKNCLLTKLYCILQIIFADFIFYLTNMAPVADSPMKVASSQPSPKKFKPDPLPAAPVKLQIAKLSENATIPTRGSARAAGYDLYSAEVGISQLNQF